MTYRCDLEAVGAQGSWAVSAVETAPRAPAAVPDARKTLKIRGSSALRDSDC